MLNDTRELRENANGNPQDTIKVCFGGFFRRPLENTLSRLVECWQLSQPPHLRHLALVRDTALSRTVTHYVHYSARNFKKLVDSGQASWEAVEFVPKDTKSEGIEVPPVEVDPQVDEYGLPLDNPSKHLLKNGDVSLLECVIAAKPPDYLRSRSDPVAVMLQDGTYSKCEVLNDSNHSSNRLPVVRDGRQKLPPGALKRLDKAPAKVRGRPKGSTNRRPVAEPSEERAQETALLPQDRTLSDVDMDDVVDEEAMAMARQPKPKKPSRDDQERFKGMSEKEILEALGLDETWTEYNVLLIERPNPGVYITPRGRRRPAGKRQGRPRISRIAVFKSPKLRLFPWFVEGETTETPAPPSRVQETETPGAPPSLPERPSATVSPPRAPVQQLPGTDEVSHRSVTPPTKKRTYQGQDVEVSDTQAGATPGHGMGRAPKKPRLNEPADTERQDAVMSTDGLPPDGTIAEREADKQPVGQPSESIATPPPTKRKRGRPPKATRQETTEVQEPAPSTTDHRVSPAPSQTHDASVAADMEEEIRSSVEASRTPSAKRPLVSRTPIEADRHVDMAEAETPSQTQPAPPESAMNVPNGGAARPVEKRASVSESLLDESEPLTKVESTADENPLRTAPPEDSREHAVTSTEAAPVERNRQPTTQEISPVPAGERALEGPTARPTPEVPTSGDSREPSQVPERRKKKEKKVRLDKGGSVSVLRRNIVMDIVEKAGGAFPLGTELWYPFTTAWMKTKYTEKPDLRTVRTTVKYLVDSGKLRQLTFSGKDSKGVMVTKHIITKPEIQPDDPLVKDMQKKMLSSESRFYFPPNTEIDPAITKSNRGFPNRGNKPVSNKLPVEPGITVNLHQKPAFVLAQERRKGQSIQRRLLQRLEGEEGRGPRRPGVVRLMRIQRSRTQNPFLNSLTSISRPQVPGVEAEKRPPPQRIAIAPQRQQVPAAPSLVRDVGRMKRLWMPISMMAPYAMLMNPKQAFHESTGTFSTEAGLAAYRKLGMAKAKAAHDLPRSLNELFKQTRRHKVDFSGDPDPRSSKFFLDNDVIARWELQNEELFDVKRKDLFYIDQRVEGPFEAAPIEGPIRFDFDEPPPPPAPAPEPIITRQSLRLPPSPSPPPEPHRQAPAEEVTPPRAQQTEDVLERYRPLPPQNRRLKKLTEAAAADELEKPAAQRAARQVVRRNRFIRNMPDALVRKIMTAIVVVRALAGGIEGKNVDWGILASIFPDYDPKFIQDRGKAILNKNRLQIIKMQSDFQDRFAEAYENDQVPRIDYDNLEAYDWEGVVNWADSQLEVPTTPKLPDLPATREQFDSLFEIREEPPQNLDEIYQYNPAVTIARKRALFAGVPFAIPLEAKDRVSAVTPQRKLELARLETAKTWVRANVITPEETYRPSEARRALERFGEELLSSAVQSLHTERAIYMGNRGRITPGRNYDITDLFLVSVGRKRPIESTLLKRAARFKTEILDWELRHHGVHEVKYNAEDGDILAIINLAAQGKVILRPSDPPRDKYGLTDGGYLTRLMDKEKLRFAIHVQPIRDTYVYGNPIKEKASTVPPPRGDMDVGMEAPAPAPAPSTMATAAAAAATTTTTTQPGPPPPPPPPPTHPPPQRSHLPFPGKIPVWYDVHRNFVKVIWDQVVAAVVGCVATRPGISAVAIANMVKPTMGAWEVELLLEWMAEVGIVKRQRQCLGKRELRDAGAGAGEEKKKKAQEDEPGWEVREWWWMILG